jgi:hypothetical protein
MVPCLQKVDSILADQIHDAMFLREAAGPCAGRQILQGLRFSHASEGVSQYCLYQIQSSECCFSINLNPVAQVFNELRMKYSAPTFTIWPLWRWFTPAQAQALF